MYGKTQDGIAVEDVFMVHGNGRHVARPGSGGQKHARRAQHDSRTVQALHLDVGCVEEDAAAADQLDLVARELRLQITS